MKAVWTALALAGAVLLETALGLMLPARARMLDPFLLVVVYCALNGGETPGMLTGMAAGWIQDVLFGGRLVGLSAVTRLLLGFAVGAAGAHFLLGGPAARALVLVVATLAEHVLFQWLAAVFDVATLELSPLGLAGRASVNAVAGTAVYALIERRPPLGRRA